MGWSAFQKRGLIYHNPNLSVKGYTLFSPSFIGGVYLIDMQGQVVKKWSFDDIKVGLAKLLPNGNLMLGAKHLAKRAAAKQLAPDDHSDLSLRVLRFGGGFTTIREYDWDGNLVWSYDNDYIHHDFHLFDNDDLLLPEWVTLPEELVDKVEGGYRKAERHSFMFGDDIIRVNRSGDVIGRWHIWQMLDPANDPIGPLESRLEWTHMNSVHVMPDGQFVASLRQNSRVILINPETHQITWRLKEPEISLQHHATPVPGGNIQIFDNGYSRPQSLPFSQVIEVDPRTSEIVWCYKPSVQEEFFSGHLSSAQRLAQGNVLICEGTPGRLFEITRSGGVVWEWYNPFIGGPDNGRRFPWLYRAYRYPLDHQAFTGKVLDPVVYRDINVAYGLML